MSFQVPVKNPKHKGSVFEIEKEPYFVQWFINSWDALERNGVSQKLYEKHHNVKLIYSSSGSTISVVEFPSEDDAIMFMLRWS